MMKEKKSNLNPTRRLSAVHGAARGEGRETAVTSGCFEPLCVCMYVSKLERYSTSCVRGEGCETVKQLKET